MGKIYQIPGAKILLSEISGISDYHPVEEGPNYFISYKNGNNDHLYSSKENYDKLCAAWEDSVEPKGIKNLDK